MENVDLINNLLMFHGTCETIEGPLRGGGYDNILWTAECSVVAQNYIPVSGSIIHVREITTYELKDGVFPHDFELKLCGMMGYKATIYSEKYGRPSSWAWYKDGESIHLTKKVLKDFIENELQYKPVNGMYKIRMNLGEIKRADYKIDGQLFIMSVKPCENLKLYDYRRSSGGDLQDPEYNHLKNFKKIREMGYDGVIINDFVQSENWGNVGHTSTGLFPSGIEKVDMISIPATNFDWNESLRVSDTPEYKEFAIKNALKLSLQPYKMGRIKV